MPSGRRFLHADLHAGQRGAERASRGCEMTVHLAASSWAVSVDHREAWHIDTKQNGADMSQREAVLKGHLLQTALCILAPWLFTPLPCSAAYVQALSI